MEISHETAAYRCADSLTIDFSPFRRPEPRRGPLDRLAPCSANNPVCLKNRKQRGDVPLSKFEGLTVVTLQSERRITERFAQLLVDTSQKEISTNVRGRWLFKIVGALILSSSTRITVGEPAYIERIIKDLAWLLSCWQAGNLDCDRETSKFEL